MSQLSSAELTRMRTRPHRTIPYLAIYEPTTVLAAQIDHSGISKGEYEIDISVISGAVASVKSGMTVYIGTTPGAKDKGRLRVRSISASQITLAENAIDWINGWYLTIVAFFEPWAVFPRIVLDADNVPLFYKDFDISYTDQNQKLDPVVNMGPHDAGFLTTGAYSVYYSSSGSFDPTDGSLPTGFLWAFEGGTPTGSNEPDPGWVHYTGAGHFTTELRATTNKGKELTGYRHIMIYDRPDAGPNRPIVRWGIRSFDGSRDDGGYNLSLFVRERADFSKVRDGALIVIFTETWQGGQRVSVGGNAENRSDILFCGYVESESIFLNSVTNSLEFRARSITGIMESLSTYSATLESKTNAVTWNEMRDMTVDKAIVHFLRWHSTVAQITDFAPTGDEKRVQYMDFSRGNLKEAISELYESTIGAQIVADRQGKMWAEIDGSLRSTGSRGLNTALELTRQDWRDEITIEYTDRDDLAYLEMGGIGYSGPTTGTFDAYLAGAPGDVAGYHGGVERTTGLVVGGQAQLNEFVGLAYARANAEFREVVTPLAGDYRHIDIAPQERILLTLVETDTFRRVVWTDKPFLPTQMEFEWFHEDQAVLPTVTLREETNGPPGTTIEIPEEPPWDTGDLPDFDIDFPPIIPLPILPLPIEAPPGTGATVYACFTAPNSLVRTRNFWDVSPNWESVPLTGVSGGNIKSFVLDPVTPHLIAYVLTATRLFKTVNLDSASPTWTAVIGATEMTNLGLAELHHIGIGEQAPDVLLVTADLSVAVFPNKFNALARSFDGGGSWGKIDGNFPLFPSGGTGKEQVIFPSPRATGVCYLNRYIGGTHYIYRSTNFGAAFVQKRSHTAAGGSQLTVRDNPFAGNTSENNLYWTENFLFYESHDGATSRINISMFFESAQWYCVKPNQSQDVPEQYFNMYVHPVDDQVYSLLQKTGSTDVIFATQTPGVGWDIRHRWTHGELVFPLGMMPTNPLLWYALVGDSFGMFSGSDDGGYTFTDKEGDFESAVDLLTNLGDRVFIGPAYTI